MSRAPSFSQQHGYSFAAKRYGDLWRGRLRQRGLLIAETQPYFTKPAALAAARHLVAKIESRNRATS